MVASAASVSLTRWLRDAFSIGAGNKQSTYLIMRERVRRIRRSSNLVAFDLKKVATFVGRLKISCSLKRDSLGKLRSTFHHGLFSNVRAPFQMMTYIIVCWHVRSSRRTSRLHCSDDGAPSVRHDAHNKRNKRWTLKKTWQVFLVVFLLRCQATSLWRAVKSREFKCSLLFLAAIDSARRPHIMTQLRLNKERSVGNNWC